MSLTSDMQRIDKQRAQMAERRAQEERRRDEYRQKAAETAAAAVRSSLHVAQNVLNGGEISPQMAARVDQPRYQTGCEKLENMIPLPQGGITKRPGLECLGCSSAGTKGIPGGARFLPFIFSASESRMLELIGTDAGTTVNVWLSDGSLYKTGAASLPYRLDELPELCFAQSADVIFLAHHNHPPAKLSRYADDDWRYERIDWLPSIAAPRIVEAVPVGNIPAGENSRTSYSYVATAIDGATGEESPPSTAVTVENVAPLSQSYFIRISLSQVEGASEYRIYKKKGGVFGYIGRLPVSDDVLVESVLRLDGAQLAEGRRISGTFRQAPGRYLCTVAVRTGNSIGGGTTRILEATVSEDTEGRILWRDDSTGAMLLWAADPAEGDEQPTGAWSWYVVGSSSSLTGTFTVQRTDWGWADDAPVTEGASLGEEVVSGLSFEDRNFSADTEDTPPDARDPFDDEGKYPAVVFLHQQRLGFAASDSQPLTVWLSQAGNFESMAASIPPSDDDAIEATLAATQANRILWCQSDRNGLALGTEGGEWILAGADGGAVTPSNLSFQPQTFYGAQPFLPVLRTGSGLVYLQRGGRVVREFGYNFSADRYESGDLSLLARHVLRDSPVVSWAWQAEPHSIIWCVLEDGTLAGLTYMREHDVIGWHRHSTPGGTFEDVAVIPGPDGNSQIWFHVTRGGVRYVERLANFYEGGTGQTPFHVDGQDKTPFSASCIPCMPETTLENGSTIMRVRKLNAVKCRVINSSPFTARVGDGPLMPVPARGAGQASLADWAVPLAGGWRDGGKLELVFDGPQPVTLLAVLTTVELADMTGGQG